MPSLAKLTKKHYEGIGRVIVSWAALERSMIPALQAVMEMGYGQRAYAIVAFWHADYRHKLDRLTSLIAIKNRDEKFRKSLDTIVERMETAAGIRNLLAHATWFQARGRHTITPPIIQARGGKLKLDGIDIKPEHFTAERLFREARTIERLTEDFRDFFRAHFGAVFTAEEIAVAKSKAKKRRN